MDEMLKCKKDRKGFKLKPIEINEKAQRNIVGWLIFLPTILLTIFFTYRYIYIGIKLSFFETKGFNAVSFAGLKNYVNVFKDSLFKKALMNMVKYECWSIVFMTVPFFMAIVINELFRGKSFFRFATYLPCVLPAVTTSLIFATLFNPSEGGFINMLLGKFGIGPFGWLQDPKLVIPTILSTGAWHFGGTMIYYLASMQSLNPDLYEAAEIDGARIFGKFRYILLPHLLPMLGMMFITNFLGTFQIFDQPLAMTNGGPNNASLSLGMLAYNYAFSYLQVGRSTATSVVMSLIINPFAILYFVLSRKGKQ